MSATERANGVFYWLGFAIAFGAGLAWWDWYIALGFALFWPASSLVYLGYWMAS